MKTQSFKIPGGKDGVELSAILSAPDDKSRENLLRTVVIMAHDIPFSHSHDHDNLYPFLRTVFDDHGYHTLMFDFESCGDSYGREEDFTLQTARDNLQAIIQWARQKRFEHIILVGAGVAAALCLEFTDKDTKMVFLFWPIVDLAAYAHSVHGIGPKLVEEMKAYKPDAALKSLKVPVLIQYGAKGDDAMESAQIDLLKTRFHALRLDITSYMDGGPGLTDPRHRKMIGHHMNQFLHKYA